MLEFSKFRNELKTRGEREIKKNGASVRVHEEQQT